MLATTAPSIINGSAMTDRKPRSMAASRRGLSDAGSLSRSLLKAGLLPRIARPSTPRSQGIAALASNSPSVSSPAVAICVTVRATGSTMPAQTKPKPPCSTAMRQASASNSSRRCERTIAELTQLRTVWMRVRRATLSSCCTRCVTSRTMALYKVLPSSVRLEMLISALNSVPSLRWPKSGLRPAIVRDDSGSRPKACTKWRCASASGAGTSISMGSPIASSAV